MSWESLIDALQSEPQSEISACPMCGEPLRGGPHGERFCPFDGWTA